MATTITYDAKQRKALKTVEWAGRGDTVSSLRKLKMVRPICNTCQVGLDTPVDWYDHCEHDPYWSLRQHVTKVPTYKPDPANKDGEDFQILEEVVTRVRHTREPNVTEVPLSVRFNDGRGPSAMRAKGFRYMQEVGLAPMCEFGGCGKAWPTIRTQANGDYCSDMHARLAVAEADEVMFVKGAIGAADAAKVRKQYDKQLREVDI